MRPFPVIIEMIGILACVLLVSFFPKLLFAAERIAVNENIPDDVVAKQCLTRSGGRAQERLCTYNPFEERCVARKQEEAVAVSASVLLKAQEKIYATQSRQALFGASRLTLFSEMVKDIPARQPGALSAP
ncbi:MAG TPA: hypothetical protein VJH89_01660, partial [Patescibacteria group bacterium]|nr:hypothetical protein [Patescibacteria group bacterium]